MGKTALVLSGGGAKGAFQVGAERYAREVKGYKWDIISGVSVGALNAALLGMGKFDRLREIWNTITADQVYGGTKHWRTIAKLVLGRKAIYDTAPLAKIIDDEIDTSLMRDVDVRIGTVCLMTGEYHVFRPSDPGFKKALVASTAIPLLFPPVDIAPNLMSMVDGSIRNFSPLRDVLDANPDEIVVIHCNPRKMPVLTKQPENALRIGHRSIEISSHLTFVSEVNKFLRVNRLVEQLMQKAAQTGIDLQLCNKDGRPYKYIKCTIIEPDTHLGEALDFTRQNIDRHLLAGWVKAKEVFDPPTSP